MKERNPINLIYGIEPGCAWLFEAGAILVVPAAAFVYFQMHKRGRSGDSGNISETPESFGKHAHRVLFHKIPKTRRK